MINNKKVAAIIAEYNPFHNGHLYHIECTKRLTGADYVIILMSGNFVQRGEIAIVDKLKRAKLALQYGADAVFELPFIVASASTEIFARGSVALANALGFVDYLSFGAETDNIKDLEHLASITLTLDDEILKLLKKGLTYPLARKKLLLDLDLKDEENIIKTPNNILAISYISNLIRLKSNILPVVVNRKEAEHNEDSLESNKKIASAKAIRKDLLDLGGMNSRYFLPSISIDYLSESGYLCNNDLSTVVYTRLSDLILNNERKISIEKLSNLSNISYDLANRIYNNFNNFRDFSSFSELLWSKNYTLSRINRAIINLVSMVDKALISKNKDIDFCPFIKPLAIKHSSMEILNSIKKKNIPLIGRYKDVENLPEIAYETYKKDRFMNHIYNEISYLKFGKVIESEFNGAFFKILH